MFIPNQSKLLNELRNRPTPPTSRIRIMTSSKADMWRNRNWMLVMTPNPNRRIEMTERPQPMGFLAL